MNNAAIAMPDDKVLSRTGDERLKWNRSLAEKKESLGAGDERSTSPDIPYRGPFAVGNRVKAKHM